RFLRTMSNPNIRIRGAQPSAVSALSAVLNQPRGRTNESAHYHKGVAQLVAEQAFRTPDALALHAGADSISYEELDRKANPLAHYLISLGVGSESIVGICLERSPEAVVCALAVFKAGGAYLPLDPAYPRERLSMMLNDAQPRVVLTTSEMAGHISEGN